MRFIVRSTTPLAGTKYRILRWGDCAADQLSAQATTGEVALFASNFDPTDITQRDDYWEFDTSNSKITYNGPIYSESPALQQETVRRQIYEALRATDWMVLPDSPLTAAQITEATNKRAYWRAIPTNTDWWTSTWDFTLPAYAEF